MAVGLQKLSAGSGYEYLTRQVAALDVTGRGHGTLADYYSAKGESPGVWAGDALAGVGMRPGEQVTAGQMKLLFGAGLNPTSGERLGRRFSVFSNQPGPFETELANRITAWQDTQPGPVPASVRDGLRTELAREWFSRDFGRPPSGPRELHGFIATATSRGRTAVAGFDVTFTPPKSVSALWALADRHQAQLIRAAHQAAVADALRSAQRRVVFTRQGHQGARHVEVRGLLAAVFVHRDSRAGDPNLHSHVAISSKVQTLAGDWMALDAQILYRAKVTLSEEYTTSLQARLSQLGLGFVATGRDGKRPVFEIAGVDPRLLAGWSSRRRQITGRTAELVAAFEADHERPPTAVEKLDLAQQATLDTRAAKHEPGSEAEQRAAWRAQANHILGVGGVDRMLVEVWAQPVGQRSTCDDRFMNDTARRVVGVVESERSAWTVWHVRSEVLRQVRAAGLSVRLIESVVAAITERALGMSVPIVTSRSMPVEPDCLRRVDGASVYEHPAATHYTSQRILDAEQRLVTAAGFLNGRVVDGNSVTLALLQTMANREPLNPGQQMLVRDMAGSGCRVQVAIAPAGTGKTTAMRTLAAAWINSGGTVLGVAPSAAAADALRTQLGDQVLADNLAKLVWAVDHGEPLAGQIGPDTLVIVDEAGMADTLTLDRVVGYCLHRGASVRLIGDDQQLGAVGAGGILRDIIASHGGLRLDEVVRFANPAEAAATLALRAGNAGGVGFYLDHDRIHVVDPDTAAATVLRAWRADTEAGLDSLMLAATRRQVTELNAAARAARVHNQPAGAEVDLADGNRASRGDVILTRRNNRALATGATAWVRNGDRWRITTVHRDGSLDVQHLTSRARINLPADYVASSVELGYATTIHGAQGITADVCHGLLDGTETRQQLYTLLSRGRHANHAWLQVTTSQTHVAPVATEVVHQATATQLLEGILDRDQAPLSATTLTSQADDPARLLGPAVTCYLDAITYAAEHHLDQTIRTRIDTAGEHLGLTGCDAWPALRSHLMLIAANHHDPVDTLQLAAGLGSLETARDPAAVIDHRLDLTTANRRTRGPLPWLPGIPTQLLDNPTWKTYLAGRYTLTRQLAQNTHQATTLNTGDRPAWSRHLPKADNQLIADVELWRAAHSIPDNDLRPTGPPVFAAAERRAQNNLDQRVDQALDEEGTWTAHVLTAAPRLAGEPGLPFLVANLAGLASLGHNAHQLLNQALQQRPLPDHHPAHALNYRINELADRAKPPATWEVVAPPPPHRPEDPPRMRPRPDRGISI